MVPAESMQRMYLYHAVDSNRNIIDFHLNKVKDTKGTKYLFKKVLWSFHVSNSRVITVDKNPAYLIRIEQLKKEKSIPLCMLFFMLS